MNSNSESTQDPKSSPGTAEVVSLSRRQSLRRLQAIVGLISAMVVSSAVIVWAVSNLCFNLMAYRASTEPAPWWISGLIILLLCGGPLIWGLVSLFRSLGPREASVRESGS